MTTRFSNLPGQIRISIIQNPYAEEDIHPIALTQLLLREYGESLYE